jgi:hypothetical protein
MRVRLRYPDQAYDEASIISALDAAREGELTELYAALREMRVLLEDMARARPRHCLALTLARLYPDTSLACGGCPACRLQGQRPYADALNLSVEICRSEATAPLLNGDLAKLAEDGRPLVLLYDPPATLDSLASALVALIRLGVQQIVLPDTMADSEDMCGSLVKKLSAQPRTPHRIIAAHEVYAQAEHALFRVPTAAVYPADEAAADRLHRALGRTIAPGVHRIIIAPRSLYLPSEHGRLIERVEGLSRDLSTILHLGDNSTIDLF